MIEKSIHGQRETINRNGLPEVDSPRAADISRLFPTGRGPMAKQLDLNNLPQPVEQPAMVELRNRQSTMGQTSKPRAKAINRLTGKNIVSNLEGRIQQYQKRWPNLSTQEIKSTLERNQVQRAGNTFVVPRLFGGDITVEDRLNVTKMVADLSNAKQRLTAVNRELVWSWGLNIDPNMKAEQKYLTGLIQSLQNNLSNWYDEV